MLRNLWTTTVAVCCLSHAASAQSDKEQFLRYLTTQLLEAPAPTGNEIGWEGVVLASNGTALSPYITSLETIGPNSENTAQILANARIFDSPLLIRNGVAFPKARKLHAVWEDVLRRCIPETSFSERDFIADDPDAARVLFTLPDRIDAARGVAFEREPSVLFKKYMAYRALYHLYTSLRTEETWKLHPRLSKYVNLDDPEAEILKDWERFGARSTIERALKRFDERMGDWYAWSKAAAIYDSKVVSLGKGFMSQPKTVLTPEPETWLASGSWKKGTVDTGSGQAIHFQYLTAKIVRDWFKIEEVASGRLRLNSDSRSEAYTISNGTEPTLTEYPDGELSVFATDLILVREVVYAGGVEGASHPLTKSVSPQRIQLLGFVVQALKAL